MISQNNWLRNEPRIYTQFSARIPQLPKNKRWFRPRLIVSKTSSKLSWSLKLNCLVTIFKRQGEEISCGFECVCLNAGFFRKVLIFGLWHAAGGVRPFPSVSRQWTCHKRHRRTLAARRWLQVHIKAYPDSMLLQMICGDMGFDVEK